jgi:hypothetical protein
MSMLDAITNEHERIENPPEMESKRLTTGQVLVALSNMGKQISRITEEFSAIPDSAPTAVTEHLKSIVSMCGAVMKNAERLMEGNR